jgi:asparagine synthase (glutamine-hydrolysing)
MCGIWMHIGANKPSISNTFNKLKHRGPNQSQTTSFEVSSTANITNITNITFGFHRLAIVDTSDNGMQPFEYNDLICICNGEIYNWEEIEQELVANHHDTFKSRCDCEVIAPLFDYLCGDITTICNRLDGEFAFIIYNKATNLLYYATDELSTRPLFIGSDNVGGWYFSSELAGLNEECKSAFRVPAGGYGIMDLNDTNLMPSKQQWYWDDNNMTAPSTTLTQPTTFIGNYAFATAKLREIITRNVSAKLHAGERRDGFFLSGGIDSSIVCAIAASMRDRPITTFTVGFSVDSPDIQAARTVAEHIGSDHHEYIVDYSAGINSLREIVTALGSYCQTTVRASTPMFLLLECIKREYPDIYVLCTGELADELFGSYLYFKRAPSPAAHREESISRLREVHMYDGLRCDRICNHFSVEARYPFFSSELIEFVMSLPPEFLDPSHNGGIEKKILRKAFSDLLPYDILWRKKDAFSDATSVKSDWKEQLKAYADAEVSDAEFAKREDIYPHNTPKTREDMLYRNLFSVGYHKYANTIAGSWMPKWCGDVVDSSATVLGID